MVKIKNKHRLKQREIRHLIEEIQGSLDVTMPPQFSTIESGTLEQYELIFLDNTPCLFRKENKLYFTLQGIMHLKPANRWVMVDMGAIKFVTNGADVMTPGIVNADQTIEKDDSVWICDETHKKALAVGKALISGQDMKKQGKGKAVLIYHYIGDELWNMLSAV